MHRKMHRRLYWFVLSLGTVALIGGLALLITTGSTAADPPFEVVASDLDNPRGLDFGPEGALYVAEAGRGGGEEPCLRPGPFGSPRSHMCFGSSGAVTRVWNGEQQRVVTGLPSMGIVDDKGGLASFPDGWFAVGPHDISLHGRGGAYIPIGLGPASKGFRQLFHMSASGQVRPVADLGAYELENNPDPQGGRGSDPYSVVALPGKRIVVDAAGNDLLQVRANGDISTLAVFPARPFGGFDMNSVPTSVTVGTDGAYYVGELTGFPFPVGEARVYRIPTDHNPEDPPPVYLEGFTQIIDLAYHPDGSLYVLEIATTPLTDVYSGGPLPTGALVRVNPDHSRETLLSEGLTMPTGLAIGPDGDAIYIADCGVCAGEGRVIRLGLD